MTVVVMFGSPNSFNGRNDNSRMRSRVRRGAFGSMAGGSCFLCRKHTTEFRPNAAPNGERGLKD